MRPASSLAVKWMSVLSILVVVFTLANFAAAQAGSTSKHKQHTSHQAPLPVAAQSSLPPATTDTWNGGGGSNTNWSDASNWNNGAITSGENIAISTTTASTVVDQAFSIGTLTLSNAGDSASLNNNVLLTLGGNVSNAGTITFNGNGNNTGFYLGGSVTLSGSGTVVMAAGGTDTDIIYGASASVLTNQSTITGTGTIGSGSINVTNSGTINANISGANLLINPDTCSGCTNSNTGTLEATSGGSLTLAGGTWTNTGGTIKAATGSTVNLQGNVSITNGTLTTSGTGVINDVGGNDIFLNNVTNSGAYVMQNNALTEISGTITNTGTMTMQGAGNSTGFYLTGNAILAGSGTIAMTPGSSNTDVIYGASGTVLTNQTTIQGAGNIGNGQVALVNASNGVINANASGVALTLQPYGPTTATNAGLMEATSGGALNLNAGTWTNTGTIEAAAGSTVNLYNNVSITGGTLESVGTGSVNNLGGYDVFLTGLTLAGTYNIQNNAATEINGTITNNGTINLLGSGNQTGLYVTGAGSGSATLTGSGSIVLGNGGGNTFWGASGTSLTIDQNVSGVGNIGNGQLTLTNNSTINANVSPTVANTPLYIQPSSGGMTNTGILEATNGGTLALDGGAINNAGATIQAVGSDSSNNPSTVDLYNNVGITGGTLSTSGAGQIVVLGGYSTSFANLTIGTGSVLNVQNNGQINTSGTITNNGTITLQGSGNATYFYAPANTTLTGTGSLVLGSTASSYSGVVEAASGMTLTNNETITGAGTIQDGTFINNGTVNSSVSGQTLVLQSFQAATNTKTMEATNGGTLAFNGSTWTNTGATITAGTGSAVELYNNTSITGGTLSTSGTGQIFIPGGYTAILTGLTTSGTLNVQNNGQLQIAGTINNTGTINLLASGNNTYLYAPTTATLSGGGTVVMGSTGGNYSGVVQAGATLTNNETITGAGTIQDGTFVNGGTINSSVSGQTLLLQSFTAATNTKTMEATNGGTLAFNGSSWTNTGGTISAATGSAVELYNGASITGGTLSTAGTGQFFTPGGYISYLTNLTNSGTFNVLNNAETQLTGTITNNGSFNLVGNGNSTYLFINGAVTLKGTGIINLGGSAFSDAIYGVGTTPTLTSFNTIEGSGNIGSGNMGFTNSGILDSNISGGTLAINVNSSGFTNYNGTTTTLTGGTYIANGGNITFNAGNSTGITTLAASVTEEAGGQLINTDNSTNALTNLTSITSAGSLTTNINFTDAGAFSNAGALTILAGTTFKVGSLTQISSGSLTAGTYVLNSNLDITGAAQTITTNAATLTLAGGTIENTSNSTNALASLATNTGKLTLAGDTAFTTSAASFSNTGTLTVNAGSTFTAPALTQISGTTLSGGTFILGGNLDLNSGVSIATNSSTLTLEGGTIMSGSSNALAGLSSNTKSLTLANNANFTTTGNFSNTGTLTVNTGSTFTVAGTLSQMHTTTNTLQGGTFVVGGTLALAAGTNGIEIDAANITMDGSGTIKNTTSGANANALLNFNTISSTGAFTLGSNANFTTIGNFTNSGKLTINSGSTFSVAGTLSNLSSGTLTGGTYTVGGTLQLASANGGITTNAASLTLTGTTAKILDGTSNALSTLNNNTGSLTLSSNAVLTTAASNFTNSGTVTVSKGSTLTVGGTGQSYTQTAGTTTVDGTLAGGGTTGITVTGGTMQGAGTLKTNVSSSATINVGDAGKAGLLSITGTYTQLSTGTMNVSIGGTTVGTQYSQLKVSGTASLGGTLTAALVNSFTPTVGQTFTILAAHSVTGTFTNTTIAINSTEHFAISYTSTSVVLTVVSGPASKGSSAQPAAVMATAKPSVTFSMPRPVQVLSNLRHPILAGIGKSGAYKPILVASTAKSNAVLGSGDGVRVWERTPITPSWKQPKTVAVLQHPTEGVVASKLVRAESNLRSSNNFASQNRVVPVGNWGGVQNLRPEPIRIMKPMLPKMR